MITRVMWFRKDLRLEDNTAFYHALESLYENEELLCVFHLDKQQYKVGEPSHDYFFSTLNLFKEEALQHKVSIHLLTGDLIDTFDQLKKQFPHWKHLYFNLDNRGFGRKRDLSLSAYLESQKINIHYFEEAHLHQATAITKSDGSPYKKFTPYYKKWLSLPKPDYRTLLLQPFLSSISHLPELSQDGDKELRRLLDQRLFNDTNNIGEDRANDLLNQFVLNRMSNYADERDFPYKNTTSHLSQYLANGQLSIRKVWHVAQASDDSLGKETFLKELAWRDFYHMIYHYHPNQFKEELIEKYRSLNWQSNSLLFEAWKLGKTGYPIIDAAMRQLNETGWMHNRLRMLTASFLTKDLLIDWRLGERYFAEKLIDYDAASNIGGWQWAASTGTDAVPYFRIFNPTTQSIKFDKQGAFIKKYLPELSLVPTKYIHDPSQMPLEQQQELNFFLGKEYPEPIVNHALARKRVLNWFDLDENK